MPVATGSTSEKSQAKVWRYDNRWWCVAPTVDGSFVWRLDGRAWTAVHQLSSQAVFKADAKVVGDVVHILYFADATGSAGKLASLEYVPGAMPIYRPWVVQPEITDLVYSTAEAATIDVDSTGRMWTAWNGNGAVNVRYAEYPYHEWSDTIVLASSPNSDDIALVTALPNDPSDPNDDAIGVLWSNQATRRFGFRTHVNSASPYEWTADEIPASQSALNTGAGMADDHLDVAVSADGTLYAVVKTGYDTAGQTHIGLLVRRTSGVWDGLHTVDAIQGTRPIVILNEALGRLMVAYRATEQSGPILFKETATSSIDFGATSETLIAGNALNNPTSTKQTFSHELVVLASTSGTLAGVLLTSSAAAPQAPDVDAGPDQTIYGVATATLNGSAAKGQPAQSGTLTAQWTKISGSGTAVFMNASAVDTTVAFSSPGVYVLQLTAFDQGRSANDRVTITVPGIAVTSVAALVTTERGRTAAFNVKLDFRPVANVTIGLALSDATEGVVAPASLLFTPDNWDIPQAAIVSGLQDDQVDGRVGYTLLTAPAISADSAFHGRDARDLPIVNLDDDLAATELFFALETDGIVDGYLAVANEDIVAFDGTSFRTFFDGSDVGIAALAIDAFSLINENEILISLAASGPVPGLAGTVDDSDIVKFTSTSWADDTAGVFELFFDASDVGLTTSDEDIDALEWFPGGQLLISTRGSFVVPGPGGINITGDDKDLLEFTPTSLGPGTSGAWSFYFDGSDVGLTTTSEDLDAFTLDASGKLYFSTTGSFSVEGIAGADDDVFVFTPSSLGAQTSGTFAKSPFFKGSLHGLAANDVVAIEVPLPAPSLITVSPVAGLRTAESGDWATFSIVLDVAPTSNVVVGLSSNDPTEGNVSPPSLVFTPSDWNVPQIVTVAGVDDDQIDGSVGYTVVTESAVSDDFKFDGNDADDIAVINLDDDLERVTFFFALEADEVVGGSLGVANEDIIGFDGSRFRIFFDGSDVGLSSLAIDAFSIVNQNEAILSLAASGAIPGIAGTVDDSDLVKFTAGSWGDSTSGVFELYFDASDVGLTTGDEDIDAISQLPNGHLLVSTRGLFDVPGPGGTSVLGDDKDMIEFTPASLGSNTAGTWTLYFDGSDVGLTTTSEDLDALAIDASGRILLSTAGGYSVAGLSGLDDDVFVFTPSSLGENTAGTFDTTPFFEGKLYGLTANDIIAIEIPAAGSDDTLSLNRLQAASIEPSPTKDSLSKVRTHGRASLSAVRHRHCNYEARPAALGVRKVHASTSGSSKTRQSTDGRR